MLRAGRPRQCPYSSLLREGLAPPPVTRLSRVGSYPTISTLPVPPSRASLNAGRSTAIGGVVSVALSLGSPRVAVSDLPALWSPDFPPANGACPPAIPRPPPAPQATGTWVAGQRARPREGPRGPLASPATALEYQLNSQEVSIEFQDRYLLDTVLIMPRIAETSAAPTKAVGRSAPRRNLRSRGPRPRRDRRPLDPRAGAPPARRAARLPGAPQADRHRAPGALESTARPGSRPASSRPSPRAPARSTR